MTKMLFQVTFLSDIVLPATSNNEGRITQLDFIPGSNFLGMVASTAYQTFEDPFKIFHSGQVRFGDAHIMVNNQPTYKIPFSFFHEKLDKRTLFNHHLIQDFKAFKQLKQKRDGYMTEDFKETEIEYSYLQKSAYDSKKRRSKESAMYGYEAIKAGTLWQFAVTLNDVSSEEKEKIKNTLTGEKSLGKSKSSQYGRIKIDFIEEISQQKKGNNPMDNNKVYLYAQSRLTLTDEEGHPTFDVRYIHPDLSPNQISYEETQIRIGTYTPYNTTMRTKCYERIVIEKGSVIVLQNISEQQLADIEKGVGAYLSEGFGEIWVNPPFLLKEGGFSLDKITANAKSDTNPSASSENISDPLIDFLMHRYKQKDAQLALVKSVEEFIRENKKYYTAMNSQWGAIRALCNKYDDQNIVKAVEEFINKGVAKEKWDGKKGQLLIEAIENASDKVAFVKLLSIQMPKETDIEGVAA